MCVLQICLFMFSFRSYSNTRNHSRRSPSSTPSTRSSSYHSPTRNSALSSSQQSSGLSRPSSPATASVASVNATPTRHSTHSPTPTTRSQIQTSSGGMSNAVDQQSPAHHRANSGPTIAINLFAENDNSNCKCLVFD